GDVYIGDCEVPLEELATKLKAISQSGYDETIFVRGDKGVNYGTVMQVMSRSNQGGFKKRSFVLDGEKGGT
ncbi:biopolymer transporter ExbD, partial [Mycobacterium tuberculosis]|nr:biopolymer transporter ExbD [Mycobacterium tuberculosis]